MPERIAHLSALRVFAVVARLLSFKLAAQQLGLSPSAVSHQIRTLETYLGVKLFERRARSVVLTEAGRHLQPALEDAFRRIGIVVRETRSLSQPTTIRLTCGPAIAAKWLAPRAYDFRERYPAIELDISVSNELVDLERDGFDAAIRHGPGGYRGVESVRLFGEAYAPMCAPHLVDGGDHPLSSLRNLARHRLLHDDAAAYPGPTSGWADWLEAAGLDPALADAGQHFAQSDHAIQAAINGAGVLLGRLSIASADLEAQRLVRPFPTVLPSPFSYFFVTAEGRSRERPLASLLAWLQAEAAASGLS